MKVQTQPQTFANVHIGIYYGAIGIIGLGLLLFVDNLLDYIPPCLFNEWTGVPCPACGASRAALQLSHAQIAASFLTNPLFFIIYVSLSAWVVNALFGWIFKRNIKVTLSVTEHKMVRILLIVAIPVNWLYLIIMRIL